MRGVQEACGGAATVAMAAGKARGRAGGGRRRAAAISGAAVAAVLVPWASAARAQCAATGAIATPSAAAAAWPSAVASASSSVATLIASINSVNTAFLTQSSAFIGSPANSQPDDQGGGVWARGVGGRFTYSTTTAVSNLNLDGPQHGTINCANRTRQDFSGVQVGGDFARLNVNGWNLHAGLTTGVLGAQSQDATAAGLNAPGSFGSNVQIPFAGIYGAASYGGLLVDGHVRGHFYQNVVSDAFQGLAGQRTGAQGVSVSANVAYQHKLGSDWYIEPSVGLLWARTAVDPLNFPGTLVSGTGSVPPSTLSVNAIDNAVGRLGLRAGTTIQTGGMMVLQPFAAVSVFHDFGGAVTSALASNFAAIGQDHSFGSTITTASLGTYTQYSLGVASQVVDTGWLGYFRADYRAGDIEGWMLSGGLRYQFVPAPVRRPAPLKAPAAGRSVYDWSGFYVGAAVGAGFGSAAWSFPGSNTVTPHVAGFLAGGDIGYDRQVGPWVFGLGASGAFINAHGTAPCPTGFFTSCEAGLGGLHTVTGRVGYAWDRLLPYLRAGAVIAQEQTRVVCTVGALAPCPGTTDTTVGVGWTAGLGYEFGLTRSITARGEIMYFDLGSDGHDIGGAATSVQRSGVMSTLGVHYRFGGGGG